MKPKNKAYTLLFSLIALFISNTAISQAQQVTFRASAPAQVVEGQQFRLVYTLNREGRDIRLPNIEGFDILFGPATSTSHSMSVVNGQSTSNTSVTYTYTLMARQTGTFTIAPASINVGGATHQSNAITITVLPPDAAPQQGTAQGNQQQSSASTSAPGTVSAEDAFIRAIVTKNNPYEQEGFTVTFRFYTTLNISDIGRIEFPEFEGFMVEEIELPRNVQMQMERYNGRNYFTADLRRVLLFPQRSGQMTIPQGRLDMTFSVPSGRRVSTFFGSQEVMTDVRRTLTTNPVTVNVRPLPTPRPTNFSNAVGTFTFHPTISATETTANEAITIRAEIQGAGNMKLIRTPEIPFPPSFEVFEPTISQNFHVATNGLTGTRTIEYMFIPRHEGEFTIPPIEFVFFDTNTNSYRTERSPEWTLQIARDTSARSATVVSRQDVRVEQDIRFLKLGEPTFVSRSNFFVGSMNYWLWFIIPTVLLTTLYILNRKQIRENANVALMKNRKANKVATKRLKTAGKYLKVHDKAKFYDEVLRALWGYFSDKLSIPVVHLSKNNIEAELSKFAVSEALIGKFMDILNTCEFARYAPAESDAAMDKLYNETVEAIGEMESKLRKK